MEFPLYQIDAFTDRVFAGNPAAICPLDSWILTRLMQYVAAEKNLSETAFLVPDGRDYALRWFTPSAEVDLCGHATLAAGFLVMSVLEPGREEVTFQTRSGPLIVRRQDDLFDMDFPARPAKPITPPDGLVDALGAEPTEVLAARDLVCLFPDEDAVKALKPDMQRLEKIDTFGIIATAPGREVDFVCRFFAPRVGVPEDPVTGSAYCTLTPFWAERLGKRQLRARQLSSRGGEIHCEHRDDRVGIAGRCVLFLSGTVHLEKS